MPAQQNNNKTAPRLFDCLQLIRLSSHPKHDKAKSSSSGQARIYRLFFCSLLAISISRKKARIFNCLDPRLVVANMRLGWFFGAPDRIPTNDPCPKLSRATRRKCFDGLITEILTQLLGEIDKDRHVDEETFDFLPLPAWGRVKINFYSAYLKTQGDPMPSSTFKELEEGELEKYSVPRPNILKDDFTGLNGFGGWSGFLGSFASTVTAMTASDPSNKSLRTVRYVHFDPQSTA